MDPYIVLGASPADSDDEIKRKYHELARLYHPDNFAGSPEQEAATRRMQEINKAYELVLAMRKGGETRVLYSDIRRLITEGNLAGAEGLLSSMDDRGAEWFFLMGSVYYRRGWYDEAMRMFERACAMNPQNPEYRQAADNMVYRARNYRAASEGAGGLGWSTCPPGYRCGLCLGSACLCQCCGSSFMPCFYR